jgi:hypothetical protein
MLRFGYSRDRQFYTQPDRSHAEQVVVEFSRLETTVRAFATSTLGQDANSLALGAMVTSLEKYDYWSAQKSINFRRALKIRNLIVHSNEIPSPSQIEDAIRSIDEIQDDLPSLGVLDEMSRLEIGQHVVRTFKKLAKNNPGRYRLDLADSLVNLSINYFELDRAQDAVLAGKEAADIHRRLSETPHGELPNC